MDNLHNKPHEPSAGALADWERAFSAELERSREHTKRAEPENATHKIDHAQLARLDRKNKLQMSGTFK